ncbi:VPLPA-CTERM sorting domain-containing protein [Tateyamaria armeniaca]|uniref:VPLPA-CTERM sorting domain-containing protein n=1 Tax=Tateyamaria armeniaca TaxID=2518930 RepID=A0ABW8UT83_9RHOB
MNRFFARTLPLLALVASASFAHAATVLDQRFDPNNPIRGAYFNEGSARVFEDFSVGSATDLGQVSIWGVHWSSGNIPANEDFRVDIRADAGGSLGASVATSTLTILSRTDTGIDHNNRNGADILEYVFDFDSDITLNAGSYWISVFLANNAPGTSWAWQRTSRSGNTIGARGSVAIVIEDEVSPVPLPTGLPLMLAGLGTLVLLRRRGQAASHD